MPPVKTWQDEDWRNGRARRRPSAQPVTASPGSWSR